MWETTGRDGSEILRFLLNSFRAPLHPRLEHAIENRTVHIHTGTQFSETKSCRRWFLCAKKGDNLLTRVLLIISGASGIHDAVQENSVLDRDPASRITSTVWYPHRGHGWWLPDCGTAGEFFAWPCILIASSLCLRACVPLFRWSTMIVIFLDFVFFSVQYCFSLGPLLCCAARVCVSKVSSTSCTPASIIFTSESCKCIAFFWATLQSARSNILFEYRYLAWERSVFPTWKPPRPRCTSHK
jgi:hypothetical protein